MASAGVRRVYSELCGAGGHVRVGGMQASGVYK